MSAIHYGRSGAEKRDLTEREDDRRKKNIYLNGTYDTNSRRPLWKWNFDFRHLWPRILK